MRALATIATTAERMAQPFALNKVKSLQYRAALPTTTCNDARIGGGKRKVAFRQKQFPQPRRQRRSEFAAESAVKQGSKQVAQTPARFGLLRFPRAPWRHGR
jgi:hypothetical protein